jgi:hypothetical protein
MKTITSRYALFTALLLLLAPVYASDACMTVCAEINRKAVEACNYPEKEIEALTECLKIARENFDACKTACGK